ncbi:MAG TPA: transglycosylase SLT domain-containing protein [Candidatus Angelobacter sp.]|nr:transglycosylase SLT domain-containing protein [Candidatus Angelobacter sp.]
MPACKINLRDVIIAEANSQGVPPEIAIAVASRESSMCHWNADGVKRGKAGEYGVMQLMPATAAALGVDPEDVNDNIHGGVKYLRQLYDRFHDWSLAVEHYNGSGPAARQYSAAVMAMAGKFGQALSLRAATPGPTPAPSFTAGTKSLFSSSSALATGGIILAAAFLGYSLLKD